MTKFMRAVFLMAGLGVTVSISKPAAASEIVQLKAQIGQLTEMMRASQAAYDTKIQALLARIETLESAGAPASAATAPAPTVVVTEAAKPAPAAESAYSSLGQSGAESGGPLSFQAGGVDLNIGLNLDVAAGSSTAPDRVVQSDGLGLQGGAHDPNTNGFTLQAAELSIGAAADPYVEGFANILFVIDKEGETVVELEEAWAQTLNLPYGLQARAGQFYTDFGRANADHVHTQDFVDQPFIITRMFGGDGQRAPGARLGWLTPLPWYSEFIVGAQNCVGETMVSFCGEDEGIGGFPNTEAAPQDFIDRMVWSGRWLNGFDFGETVSANFGVSGVAGHNRTGPDNYTYIAGGDIYAKWEPENSQRGFPFVSFEGEFLYRWYDAGDDMEFSRTALEDYGFYAQTLYGFDPGWVAGLRFEYGDGHGDSAEASISDDFTRARRLRMSTNLTWYPTEFSRFQFQYNYDWSDALSLLGEDEEFDLSAYGEDDAHSFWFKIGLGIGAHAAHTF
jgi:hypothetical protein